MSSSKQPMSGLRTVKRDWSAPSLDSDPIPWSPSPPPAEAPPPPKPKKTVSGVEARLRAIQAALDAGAETPKGVLASSSLPNSKTGSSSSSSRSGSTSANTSRPSSAGLSSGLKRSSDPSIPTTAPPPKKRQLPESWDKPQTSSSSFKRTSSVSSNGPSVVKIAPATNTGSRTASVFLSREQTQILKLVEEGNSVFYTGSAGTGKSVLLKEIIRTMRRKYAKSGDAVAVTASTGLAACNIGGMTIHSFAGIGLGVETADELAVKVRKNRKAMARWLRCKVLIIDEVSMVEADLFDKLCKIGSLLTKRLDKPFGGIQVVVTGDFFQLPPVVKTGETKFAFEADCWKTVIKYTFNLTKVFRQKDQEFIDMLNEMRFGKLSSKSIARWKSLSREVVYDDGLSATELFPRREEVDRSNVTRMSSLKTETHTYVATDGGHLQEQAQREKMLANFMAPYSLQLRVGAQVMLIKNTDELLVNGSMGTIKRFVDPAVFATERGEVSAKDESGGAADKKKGAPPPQAGVVWPVVQFLTPKGVVELMVEPATWKVELPNGECQVSRTQLPLILSWAMSIHKSQGQTLERVKVDLGKIFEKGQAYVALSRATSLEGLQVLNFDPAKVNAHPKVVEWSKTLEELKC